MTERDIELQSIQAKVLQRMAEQKLEDQEKNDDGAAFMCPADPMERLQCEACQ